MVLTLWALAAFSIAAACHRDRTYTVVAAHVLEGRAAAPSKQSLDEQRGRQ